MSLASVEGNADAAEDKILETHPHTNTEVSSTQTDTLIEHCPVRVSASVCV